MLPPHDETSYDEELGRAISLFERLDDLYISFCDWKPPTKAEDPEETLSIAKDIPYCFNSIRITSFHCHNITSLSFSGIRSKEDHGMLMQSLPQAKGLKRLSLVYRFDFLLSSLGPGFSGGLDSKDFWNTVGELEKLRKLVVAYMPLDDLEFDSRWSPKTFKPLLTHVCLEEVALSRGVTSALFQNSKNLRSLTAGKHLIQHLAALPAMPYPHLGDLDLSLPNVSEAFDALSLFKNAPLQSLAMTIPKIQDFLHSYPESTLRHPTLTNMAVYEIYSEAEQMMTQDAKRQWVARYGERGIDLEVN
ncbi:MAG: hypothetical protein CYPHOPRED_003178 [Cyphobasidiales sp. Tagirdzhanova-0007]|nr:MAG: hypothetical protein CYPHOPRED_003178 [Cyphobasidiales sp. Tagirdzhanova-0007]